jgi:hypothetical protein
MGMIWQIHRFPGFNIIISHTTQKAETLAHVSLVVIAQTSKMIKLKRGHRLVAI